MTQWDDWPWFVRRLVELRIARGVCPICGYSGGFHDNHRAARDNIPRELLKEKGWQDQ